jgi:hypothetical protein
VVKAMSLVPKPGSWVRIRPFSDARHVPSYAAVGEWNDSAANSQQNLGLWIVLFKVHLLMVYDGGCELCLHLHHGTDIDANPWVTAVSGKAIVDNYRQEKQDDFKNWHLNQQKSQLGAAFDFGL